MLKRKKVKYSKEIVEKLDRIISILEQGQQSENKMQWLILEQQEDIRKLKNKNKELKKKMEEEK